MKNHRLRLSWALLAIAAGAAFANPASPPTPAVDSTANPTPGTHAAASSTSPLMAPDARVDGKSIGEWTGRWWRWAMSQPIAPYLDPDGRICDEGQDGPVWFLAGTNGNFNPKRDCVVPLGKYLLVPVINMVYWEIDPKQPVNCADLQAGSAANNDHLVSAVVLIDGKPVADVAKYRARSNGCFVIDHDENGAELHAAADGYWLMLEPLSPGSHTLSIGANYGAPDEDYGHMQQNFEYVLHVGGRSILSDAGDASKTLLAGSQR